MGGSKGLQDVMLTCSVDYDSQVRRSRVRGWLSMVADGAVEDGVERGCGWEERKEKKVFAVVGYEDGLVESWEVRKQKKLGPLLQWLASKVQWWAEVERNVACGRLGASGKLSSK